MYPTSCRPTRHRSDCSSCSNRPTSMNSTRLGVRSCVRLEGPRLSTYRGRVGAVAASEASSLTSTLRTTAGWPWSTSRSCLCARGHSRGQGDRLESFPGLICLTRDVWRCVRPGHRTLNAWFGTTLEPHCRGECCAAFARPLDVGGAVEGRHVGVRVQFPQLTSHGAGTVCSCLRTAAVRRRPPEPTIRPASARGRAL